MIKVELNFLLTRDSRGPMDCLGVLLFCLQYLACHNGGKRVVQPALVKYSLGFMSLGGLDPNEYFTTSLYRRPHFGKSARLD